MYGNDEGRTMFLAQRKYSRQKERLGSPDLWYLYRRFGFFY